MLPVLPVDLMFFLATACFAWGASLATYRWFAVHNGWPMGEWQAHRPGLPIAIGIFAMLVATLFGLARGGSTAVILPLFGVLCALAWTALTKVGAQSTLLLAPAAVLALVVSWVAAAVFLEAAPLTGAGPASFRIEDRDVAVDRGIATDRQPPSFPAERR